MSSRTLWGVGVTSWFALCALFLFIIRQDSLSEFDPNGALYTLSMNTGFDSSFTDSLKREVGDLSLTVVHFENRGCWCQIVAQPHIESVKSLAKNKGLSNIVVGEISKSMQSRIPSLPAVAVFDQDENLIYLGPYSSGISCSQNEGIVEPFIGHATRQFPVAAIVSDAKGCYCNT